MGATYTVQRKAVIKAPPQAIFDRISHFSKWERWSPWEDLDPEMEKRYLGAPDGQVGSGYSWKGNRKAGEGSMTLSAAEAPNLVRADLQFLKPFKSTSELEWELKQAGDTTEVTWTMVAGHNLMTRVMSAVGLMDRMIGKDFEKGLARLKTLAER